MQRLRPALLAAASLLLFAGCRDGAPTSSRDTGSPARDAAVTLDGDSVSAPPVPARPAVFLPPVGQPAELAGVFDPGLSPVVEICAADDAGCAAPVARFTTSEGTGSERVRVDDDGQAYVVNWHTSASPLTVGAAYRIRVTVDGTEAASRAVRVVSNGAGRRGVDGGELPVVNGRTLPIKFRVQKVRRLTVVVDSGAAGTPPQQDTMLPYGAQVAYAYQAGAGYHGLVVTVDGEPAPASGTVAMDRDRVITASAERDRTVPAGGEPLVASARAILTEADKPAAFQRHLDLVAGVYDRMELEAAIAHMDSVYAVAYDPVADSAAIRVAHEALANHVFAVSPGHGESGAGAGLRAGRGSRAALAAAPAGKVTYFTVNGVLTDPAGAADNMLAAQKAARDAGVLGPNDEFRLFYNATFRHADNGGLAVTRCFDQAFRDRTLLGYLLLIPRLVKCSAEALGRFLWNNDLTEAIREVLNVTGTLAHGAEPDSRAWADTVRNRLVDGHNLIVMPHSQGNLVTQEALHINRDSRPETQERLCVGVVSAAAPVSGHFLLRPGLEKGLYVEYDFILWLPFTQDYTQVTTDKSKDAHKTWSKWYWKITGLSGPIEVFKRFGLHSFTDSYLGARQSRDYIIGALRAERQTLVTMPECAVARVAAVEVSPATQTLSQGGAAQLTAVARDSAGAVLNGRTFTWASSNPSVATVSASGVVTGVGQGTASITATAEGVTGSAQVTVSAIVASVEVSPSTVTLEPGATRDLDAVARDAWGRAVSGRAVAWASSNDAVATVSPTGGVTAVAEGIARVTATVDGVEGSATITVAATPPPSQSLVLAVGQASSWTVTPASTGAVTLRFDARIDAGSTAGNSTLLEVTVNGVPVTPAVLANKAADYTYTVRGGTEPYYQNRGSFAGQADPYWGLFWSPDFSQNNDPSNYYAVAGGQAYTFVLDLSAMVNRGQVNTVTLRNHGEWLQNLGLAPVIFLRDVSVQ
ncbi:MAG TPA: Ig-like domain-containing protein [Longimicrobium sp.]|nr:Ig-like domain-containing protein [Longimicrobium sp.]